MKLPPALTGTHAIHPVHRVRGFVGELRRRRVLRSAMWYIGACVAAVQAAEAFLPDLGVSPESLKLFRLLAIFGLPLALMLSWKFDIASAEPLSTGMRAKSLRMAPIAIVGAGCLTLALFFWKRQTQPQLPAVDATSLHADPAHVAILPFTAVTNDADLLAFAFNLQHRLIDGLSIAAATGAPTSKRLRVVSQSSIQPYSAPGVPIDSIRRVLNVGTIINGTVEAVGDAVRVQVRLVDTSTGDQLATTVAEMRVLDRLALLRAVADSTLLLIRQQLGLVVRDQTRRLETQNLDAFNSLAAAIQRLNDLPAASDQTSLTAAQAVFDDADSLLAEAERRDPKWIEPLLERGRLVHKRAMLEAASGRKYAVRDIYDGMRFADRALKLEPNDYRALELRGRLAAFLLSDQRIDVKERARLAAMAERDLRMSLVANPTPATCYRVLSEVAAAKGRLEEAIVNAQHAYAEDPYLENVEITVFRMFEYSLQLGRDDDAAHWCAEGRKRFTHVLFDECRLSLAAWSSYLMTADSAASVAQHELALYPAVARPLLEPRLAAMYAAVLARNHLADSARVILSGARRRDPGTAGMYKVAAGVYSLVGARDSAMLMIRKLLAANPDMRGALERSPELRRLRTDAEFRRLTQFAD